MLSLLRAFRSRLGRDAFLYLEPALNDPQRAQFAQCGTCRDFTGWHCKIFGRGTIVVAGDSCGLYVRDHPEFAAAGQERPLVTLDAAGFVRAQVRCENCAFYAVSDGNTSPTTSNSRGTCTLFQHLSALLPPVFNLDPSVAALGCCNAWMRK